MTLGGKIEAALATLIEDLEIDGLTVYKGIDDEVKQTPLASAMALSMTDKGEQTGVYHVRTIVSVICAAGDMTPEQAEEIADQIFAAVLDANAATTLSGLAADLTVFDVFEESRDRAVNGDVWEVSSTLDIVAVNS
jgi:hypothetical protein